LSIAGKDGGGSADAESEFFVVKNSRFFENYDGKEEERLRQCEHFAKKGEVSIFCDFVQLEVTTVSYIEIIKI